MTRARTRTLIGIALFLPLAVILLATFACLPAPIGDPETAKVDDGLVGAWQLQSDKKDQSAIALLRPWDKHTYYLTYMTSETKDDKTKEVHNAHFKAWLTKLGDATFIVAEPVDTIDYAFPTEKADRFWVVARIELKDDTISFRMIKPDSDIVKDLKTREKLEAAITANLDKDELYGDTLKFKKISKEDSKIVEDALKANNSGM